MTHASQKIFRVMVVVQLSSAAGRKKLVGVNRFLGEGHEWDVELIRDGKDFTPEVLQSVDDYDGLIVGIVESREMRRAHSALSTPTIFIDYPDRTFAECGRRVAFIHDDAASIAKTAAGHLLCTGKTETFGFVPARTALAWSEERAVSFVNAMGRRGEDVVVFRGDGANRAELDGWVAALPKPAAILAAFDDRARDVLESCRRLGLDVPGDVSVLGIGNDETVCEATVPPLSSVAVEFDMQGYRAARELQALMLRKGAVARAELTFGAVEVVERSSTRPKDRSGHLVRRACEFIRGHACEGISVADVVRHLRVSRRLADMRFREFTGRTILDEITERRLEAVTGLLAGTDKPISEIAVRCGYRDANYLKNMFRRRMGVNMRTWRKMNRGRQGADAEDRAGRAGGERKRGPGQAGVARAFRA